jgi:3-hydroxyisobutyrate dehydrogenase
MAKNPLSESKVAFLGMGIMGSAMAANLARAGAQVSVWNRTPGRPGIKIAEDAGAKSLDTISGAIKDCTIIFSCVSDTNDVEEILLGADGVCESAKSGALVVDTSTIGPEVAKKVAAALETRGLRFLDAPVTGGDVGAKNGTLVIMVGGNKADFDEAEPFLLKLGKSATLCGPAGSGQALKLCNQILCAANMLGLAEAYSIANNFSIDSNLLLEVLGTGAGGSWALQNLGPRIAKADYAPGFRIEDMLKDLRLIKENTGGQLELPATDLAAKLFVEAKRRGGEGLGTQAMPLAYKKVAAKDAAKS